MITHDSQGRAQLGPIEFVIQAITVLSLLAFALETLPRLTSAQRQQLRLFEIASVVVFTVEYLVRAALARQPRAYLLSFFGIIDLLAILPFYLSLGVDLRSLRAFRLLRLFRILKLARYSAAIQISVRDYGTDPCRLVRQVKKIRWLEGRDRIASGPCRLVRQGSKDSRDGERLHVKKALNLISPSGQGGRGLSLANPCVSS